ncbi:MAG: sulfate adenylyltransferase, partial [Flavisolibacter sp.]|nr:sulfate adenylyltransferase [Flavisolibacter sp.]
RFPWYEGGSLLHVLENIEVERDIDLLHARFPVQYVIRPQTEELHDYRGYAGRITSGIYKRGDAVTILPSGLTSTIQRIEIGGKVIEEAFAPQSVVLHLEDDIDISRGDVIVKNTDLPRLEKELEVLLCWMDIKPLTQGSKYLLQHNSRVVKAAVKEIQYKLDVNTLEKQPSPEQAALNDVLKVTLRTSEPIAFDSYSDLRTNGGAILIDQTSFVTVGACMIQ